MDPETVEYKEDTGTLLLLGRTNKKVLEVTTAGGLLAETDLSSVPLDNPAGLAYAPSSGDSSAMSYYIVNRAVDNDSHPTENDGTLMEVAIGVGAPPGFRVAAGSDDAEESAGGSMSLSSSDLELVYDGSNQKVGMRFTKVAIAQGATISKAYIQFEADEAQSEVTSLTIQGQAVDNAATFTSTAGNVSSRPRTAAAVSWSPSAWSTVGEAGPNQRTPDLSAVIQEIVNRPGWASGNALAIIVTGTGHRTARSYDGRAAGAALLHVETGDSTPPPPPPPPTNTAPLVNAGLDQTTLLSGDAPLDGTVSDDGQPNPPGALTTTWGMVSGPGSVTFQDASAVDTRAAFTTAGTYVLSLAASDGELSTTDQVQITVLPEGTPTTLERRIAAGTDDAEEKASGSVSLSSSDLELVYDGSNQRVGLRFTSLSIARGAVITNAYMQFKADETQSEATSLLVQGQAAGNPATFTTTSGNVSTRPRTAASASWSPLAWSLVGEAGAKQRTPNLSAVIQEIINRPDWTSGNALVLVITGTGHRTAESYEGDRAGAPLLHIEYQ